MTKEAGYHLEFNTATTQFSRWIFWVGKPISQGVMRLYINARENPVLGGFSSATQEAEVELRI